MVWGCLIVLDVGEYAVRCRVCRWRSGGHRSLPSAAATVAFKLPNLLAGSRRDYCATHTSQVRLAEGTVVVARFGPHQPTLPSLPDISAGRRRGPTRGKG